MQCPHFLLQHVASWFSHFGFCDSIAWFGVHVVLEIGVMNDFKLVDSPQTPVLHKFFNKLIS